MGGTTRALRVADAVGGGMQSVRIARVALAVAAIIYIATSRTSVRAVGADGASDASVESCAGGAVVLEDGGFDPNALSCASGDRDGDGLDNAFECPGLHACRDTDGDQRPDYDDPDSDNDGVPDARECMDENSCGTDDSDGDGVPDLLDPDRPQLSGGACGVAAPGVTVPSLGWLLATLILGLLGRRWRRIPLRRRAHKQARTRDS